jgi:predicted dehydrogenase
MKPFSRRRFLQTSAAVAGGFVATKEVLLDPAIALADAQPVGANDKLRLGIIGVGMQGTPLLETAVALPGIECVAACDLYDGRHTLAKEVAGPNITVTRRYQELLDRKDIDCLIVAVPDHWHRQVVCDAVSAGKDVYCEKPMSKSAADGMAMVDAVKKSGRILQVGSQRVSSAICAKVKEMIAGGAIGDVTMIECSLGRNDPTGAWEYPPPPDLAPSNFDWDTWQGAAPKRPFSPEIFARWRCWKEYGTGVAGDLMVHLISGMMVMLGMNEPPKRAMSLGGILRWPDGRNMPDVHATLFDYGKIPVYVRLNLGGETAENCRFSGSKGILDANEFSIVHTPQSGEDTAPSYYATGFPHGMRAEYERQWHKDHDAPLGKERFYDSVTYRGNDWDDLRPHLWNFFQAVRERKPVVEDAVFGHHAALACHMANESYFRGTAVKWDAASGTIKNA